ncbi:HflK protein [Nitrospira sp.]|nr:HflK protein [Nitrospira sp.]
MAWNPKDPWGNKDDNVDEALRRATAQLQELIPKRGFSTFALLALAVVLILQSAFIVAPDEEGVVRRFGSVVRTVGPGPHLKLPFIENVLRPKVAKLHRLEVGFRKDIRGQSVMVPREALMLTGDENILAIEFIVQYKINDSSKYLFQVDDVDDTVAEAAEAAMREVIGKTKIDDALTTGKALIQQNTQDLLQGILDRYNAGVHIAAIQLQDVDPPEAVVGAFKDVASAKEDRERLINQAQGYRNDIIPRAKGQAAEIINQAKGQAQARIARAEGEASRFLKTLKEYDLAKDVISKRIYIETMEEVLGSTDKIILDSKVGDRVLPYLPMDKFSRPRGAGASTPSEGSTQ